MTVAKIQLFTGVSDLQILVGGTGQYRRTRHIVTPLLGTCDPLAMVENPCVDVGATGEVFYCTGITVAVKR